MDLREERGDPARDRPLFRWILLTIGRRPLLNAVVERGETDYDYAFDVIIFRYGAKKGGGGEPAASRTPPNQPPVEGGAEMTMEAAVA